MPPRYDMHIHTYHCGCANETMKLPDIARAAGEAGDEWIAITDHLNRPDQLDLHRSILDDVRALETDLPVYFGVELNFTGCCEGFVFSRQIKADYGFQFAIGGIHAAYLDEFDLTRLIQIQHRHHLAVCADELVDVLVHPWWFSRHDFELHGLPFPPFETVRAVPEALTRELGQAAATTNTAIEINAGANLAGYSDEYVEAYTDYMAILADEGVTFAAASDAHDIGGLGRVRLAWELFEKLGLGDDRLWRPAAGPIVGRGSA